MPVTKDQAEMLAALAISCRPHGAPRWDAPGVVAALAKVKHLALADVMRAVANAADDRDIKTPGVLANLRSTCWQDRPVRPAPLEIVPPTDRCGICGKARARCEAGPRFADDDHRFEPDFKDKRDGETVAQIAQALKAEIQPTVAPPEPKSLDDLLPEQRDPRAAEARAHIAADREARDRMTDRAAQEDEG